MRALFSALVCVLLAACTGAAVPSRSGSASAGNESAKVASTRTTHEYRSAPPPPETAAAGASDPVQAVRAFGAAYINWTADTVAADMRTLAAESVAQARSATALAAAKTARDYELRHGGIANRGTIEAISPLLGHRHEYAVVSREVTSATNTTAYDGLRPAWHLTIAAAAELAPGRWVVNRWEPVS